MQKTIYMTWGKRKMKPKSNTKKVTKKEVKPLKKIAEEKDLKIASFKKADWFDLKHYWYILKKQFFPERIITVNMELMNGDHTHLCVLASFEGFKYAGGLYMFDNNFKYFDHAFKTYCYDFHQNLSLPIKRTIDVKAIEKAVSETEDNIQIALNPSTLETCIKARLAESAARAGAEDPTQKKIFWFTLTTLLLSAITAVVILQSSGMLNNIKIPGLG